MLQTGLENPCSNRLTYGSLKASNGVATCLQDAVLQNTSILLFRMVEKGKKEKHEEQVQFAA